MPFVQSVNGTQSTLEPTPFASLAPMAVYTMVDPGVGVGVVGVPSPNLLHAARSARPPAAMPIRRIGEWRARQKKAFIGSRICSIPFTRMAYPVKDAPWVR